MSDENKRQIKVGSFNIATLHAEAFNKAIRLYQYELLRAFGIPVASERKDYDIEYTDDNPKPRPKSQ
jgi:hypothetical protein